MDFNGPQDWAHGRVVRFLAEESGRDARLIRLDETLASFDADSLNYVEFAMDLEDELGVALPEPIGVDTVADLVEWVRSTRR